jgi:RNA polymerase sigma factor (sigma-70 family)
MIDKLPDNQKAAFVLSKVEGLSTREIASVLDTSVSGVEGLLHRAKVHLRKDLENFYKNEAP